MLQLFGTVSDEQASLGVEAETEDVVPSHAACRIRQDCAENTGRKLRIREVKTVRIRVT